MKCPKCNYIQIEFEDTRHEESIDNETKKVEEWFTYCPNCDGEFIVKEIYTLTSQEVIEDISEED